MFRKTSIVVSYGRHASAKGRHLSAAKDRYRKLRNVTSLNLRDSAALEIEFIADPINLDAVDLCRRNWRIEYKDKNNRTLDFLAEQKEAMPISFDHGSSAVMGKLSLKVVQPK